MTHDIAQHVHDPDPPTKLRTPERDTWPLAHSHLLKTMVESKEYSFREITAKINATFQAFYTRSSIIGRSMRMGMRNARPEKNNVARKPRPKLRIVRANGNSNRLRFLGTVETDLPLLRVVDGVGLNISLYELTKETCRWPLGVGPEFTFCGHKPFGDFPYCASHCRIAYVAPERRRG